MNYDEALKYINEIPWTSRKIGLHRINAILKKLGRPDRKLKFIHVAGTNGKGSVCAMLASILEKSGLKTGLFTSPHLVKYNERMKINGQDISDRELASVITKVAEASADLRKECSKNKAVTDEEYESPSEFEILTAAGLLWFYRKKCDIVVLEVGLGGEFDSTNVIENKELAVITPIALEHTAILGNTLAEITSAKAGIITEGCDVVCSLQSREGLIGNEYPLKENLSRKMEILNVVSAKCFEKKARLHIPDTFGFYMVSKDIDGQIFRSRYYNNPVKLGFIGEYQLINALTVLEAVTVLNKKGYNINDKAVVKGLEAVKWAARFEVLCRDPIFILDGAHNEHGIDAAVDSLRWLFGDKKIIYILGVLSDKNVEGMLLKLYTNAKFFITLTPDSDRALAGEKLAERLRGAGFGVVNFDSPAEAVKYAINKADESYETDEVICSLGSLYLAGNIRECLTKELP